MAWESRQGTSTSVSGGSSEGIRTSRIRTSSTIVFVLAPPDSDKDRFDLSQCFLAVVVSAFETAFLMTR